MIAIWGEENPAYPGLKIPSLAKHYYVSLTDRDFINPFVLDGKMLDDAYIATNGIRTDFGKSRAIYRWLTKNVGYGKWKRKNGYRNSVEVVEDAQGVCGEMAFLYVAMTRAVGVVSNFVCVDMDHAGRKVNHACASVTLEQGILLVDPAYRAFGIKHKEYQILADKDAVRKYDFWR